VGPVSDRSYDTPGASTAATKGPEQIRVGVRVRDEVITVRGDDRELQNVVYACEATV
jgi:hypothetical protein